LSADARSAKADWQAGRRLFLTSSLHQRVRRTIRRHALLPPGSRVLIGLSGGSDSVALTRLLLDLAEHGEFVVAGLAHLNHTLRPSADRDQEFCERFAARLRLPVVIERADVRGHAEAGGLSVEDAARRLRYSFLERVAEELRADRIAVGHTQDDQAETFLLKLMRGAGLTGLAGIHPRRGAVIRPLLDVGDRDLQAFLASEGESWVEDETNADLAIPRNRVRHRVLPELDQAAGGPTLAAIARAADLIREDGQWLDSLAEERFPTVACMAARGIELDIPGSTGLPTPVLRRVLLRALRGVAGGREIGLEHVESVMALLGKGAGGVDLPGSRAEIRGARLVLVPAEGASK
jgi:tRNA(Ile)-lysidine synthase